MGEGGVKWRVDLIWIYKNSSIKTAKWGGWGGMGRGAWQGHWGAWGGMGWGACVRRAWVGHRGGLEWSMGGGAIVLFCPGKRCFARANRFFYPPKKPQPGKKRKMPGQNQPGKKPELPGWKTNWAKYDDASDEISQ